jgi:hypothetical protein
MVTAAAGTAGRAFAIPGTVFAVGSPVSDHGGRSAGAPISPQRATGTRGELLSGLEAGSTVACAPTTERD